MSPSFPESDEFSEASKKNFTPWFYAIVFLVLAIIASGSILIARFNTVDYQRDVQSWKEKLNIIAESRVADVSHFISGNFTELRTLSDNPSLKLYLTELQMLPEEARAAGASASAEGEPSEKSYLRNLLVFTAQRAGFMSANGADAIPANIPSESKSGLVVLGSDNQLVVGTPMVRASMTRIMEYAGKQKPAEEGLIDIEKDSDGTLYMGFSVPVYSIQGEHNAASQIGKIVAIKTIDENLFALLKQPGSTEKTLETLIVRPVAGEAGKMEYISPLQDGSAPLAKQFEQQQKGSAEAYVASGEDNFASELKDYRGNQVLATSRSIPGTDWKLITKVDKKEAFAESGAYRSSLITSFALIIAVIILIIITMWWYSYSQNALMASSYFKKMAMKSRAQENMLRLVADNQLEAIYIVDANQTYWFANQKVAETVNMSADSIIGKTVSDVRGSARAAHIAQQCEVALQAEEPIYNLFHDGQDEQEDIVIRSVYIPLREIPVASLPPETKGVLVVEQDVSEVYHERERRLSTQNQLVQTLLNLVDKRDPFAANHSLLVSQVAYQVAINMGLDETTVETTTTAANLMNIGKIIVPAELLTKSGQLSDEEKSTIRASMDMAADLLEKVSFDGPVAETLRQWQERWDGTGPRGLEGENILVSARIIAVANAFIGMISPRSWRNAMLIETANKFLLEHVDSYFDRKVVVALVNYVENQSGKDWLKNIMDNSRSAA
jgi:PAS domain S-box-containing protein